MPLDDVNVHYHSSRPAQMQAFAFTRDTDIYVGPGQERHLPHEAWHAVQQKQGRVKPTLQAKDAAINDDRQLEKEADAMGARAQAAQHQTPRSDRNFLQIPSRDIGVIQRKVWGLNESDFGYPTGRGKLAEDQLNQLTLISNSVDILVGQARDELVKGEIKEMVGQTHFEGLVSYEFTERDDPRRKLGYVIEERTYALMRAAGIKFSEQNSLNFPSGITRPDIIIRPVVNQPTLKAFIDITTASDSKNHVLGKAGGAWFKNTNVVWVTEVLYDSFTNDDAMGAIKAVTAASKGMTEDEIKALMKKHQEDIAASQKAAQEKTEALKAWLTESDLRDANLSGVDMSGADMKDARLTNDQLLQGNSIAKG